MNRTSAPFARLVRLFVVVAAAVALAPVVTGGQAFALPAMPSLSTLPVVGEVLAPETAPLVTSSVPGVARRSAHLMDQHDCWIGEAPEGVTEPGHVVVTRLVDGRRVTTYGGPRLTERAERHLFERPDPGIFMVHGFCR